MAQRIEDAEDDPLTREVIGCAIAIHRKFGAGLLETSYEQCLYWDLMDCGFSVEKQIYLPLVHNGHRIAKAYRIDLIVEKRLIVEVKAVEKILPVHEAQLLTYMRLTGIPTGLLLNFFVPVLKDGIIRRVL